MQIHKSVSLDVTFNICSQINVLNRRLSDTRTRELLLVNGKLTINYHKKVN